MVQTPSETKGECQHIRPLNYDQRVCSDCGKVLDEDWDSVKTQYPFDQNRREISPQCGVSRAVETSFSSKGYIECVLAQWSTASRPSDQTEKNFAFFLSEITRLGLTLSLPKTILEETASLSCLIVEKRMTKGRSIRCLSTASIYCACRKLGQPITLEQLVASSGIGRKEIGRCYRIIIRELGLSIPRATLRPCLAHLLNEIDAEAEVANIANRLLETVEECGIATGREPSGICSAVVYMASKLIGNVKTQRRISDAAGVTETTIRKRCREIERHVQFDICL